MKKILLLITLVLGYCGYAQQTTTVTTTTTTTSTDPWITDKKHEVKLGAVKLLAGAIFEGTYEYVKSDDFTFGASVLYSFDQNSTDYPEDYSLTPFARFYFQETKQYGAKGFFVEGFAKFFKGHNTEFYYEESGNFYDSYEVSDDYHAGAVGISIGWKWINRSGFVFEILAGGGRVLGNPDGTPDGIFRGDFNIGYRF